MRQIGLILFLSYAAFGQISGDGIVASVTRTLNIPPDQADFTIVVSTTLDITQQQVTQVFVDGGFPSPVVTGVAAGQNGYTYPPSGDSQMYYQISFTTPPSAIAATAKKIDALRASLPTGLSNLQCTASLSASAAAVDAANTTLLPQLLAEARTKAKALAETASLALGAIQGITESSYGTQGFASAVIGSIIGGYSNNNSSGSVYTFYFTVKFAAQ